MTVEEMLKYLPKHCSIYINNSKFYPKHMVTCWGASIIDGDPIIRTNLSNYPKNIPISLEGVGATMHDAVRNVMVSLMLSRDEFLMADILDK